MGALTNTIDEKRYGRMLARALPRIIATARERDRAVGMVEALIEKGEEAISAIGLLACRCAEGAGVVEAVRDSPKRTRRWSCSPC